MSSGYVKLRDPLILYGLLDSWENVLTETEYETFFNNAKRTMRKVRHSDLSGIRFHFKEIYYNRNGDAAYLINYDDLDIMVIGDVIEETRAFLPEHLFEI